MKYQDPNFSPKLVNRITLYGNIITLTGSSGTADITINGTKNTTGLTVSSTLTAAASAWVLANHTFYKLRGFIVSDAAGVITVNPAHDWDTTNRINATIANLTGDLSGTYTGTFTLDGSKAKIWEVVLTTATVNFATPVGMKDGQTIKIIFVASTTSAVTTSALVYINGTSIVTFDVDTQPYIIDGMYTNTAGVTMSGRTLVLPSASLLCQSAGSLMQSRTGEIFYPLQDQNGVEITDELGNQILIPEQVYIY
jgi:hypothetical protein